MRPGIPLIGQQQVQQQTMATQIVMNCYLNLIPVVAAKELERQDQFSDREGLPNRIANEAWRITLAVAKQLGIEVANQG